MTISLNQNVVPIMLALSLFLLSGFAAAGDGEVRGRVDCKQYAGVCLFKGLALKGPIDDSMAESLGSLFADFQRQADGNKQPSGLAHTQIRLDSPGGSVRAAMAIGRMLRKHRLTAVVRPGAICNSACVLIYAGAVVRHGHFNSGVIGIHQPFFEMPGRPIDVDEIRKTYARMLEDIRSYFREMNVSEQLADEMLKTPPNAIRYLTSEEQDHFGLVIFDPIETEIANLEQTRELGIERAEFTRRQALVVKICPLNANYSDCNAQVMKTGNEPAADFSQFGTPVK
jgi:ATP-dependent protease ClpP protease subunit